MKNYLKKFATLLTTLTLVVVLGVCLTACGSSDKELSKDEYKANLEEAKYTVMVAEKAEDFQGAISMGMLPKDVKAENIEWAISASNSEGEDGFVMIAKFNNSDDAKKTVEMYEKMADEAGSESKGSVMKRIGNTAILASSKTAYNAAYGK